MGSSGATHRTCGSALRAKPFDMPSRVQSLVHVTLRRYVDLFIPSLQWIPWPPLAGALRFSTFIGTMESQDCSPALACASGFPWPQVLLVESLFASLGEPLVPHGTWLLWVGRNRAQMSGEAGSSPGFAGNPLVSMPRASDSGDSSHASHTGVPDTAFRAANGVGIAMRSISELNPHGLLTHCVPFAPASHTANGNTRYRPARYGFDRAGLAPAGLQ